MIKEILMKIYPGVQVHSVFLKARMVDKILRNRPPMRSILKRAEDYDKGNEDKLNMAPVNTLPKEATRIFGAFIRVNTFTSLLMKE